MTGWLLDTNVLSELRKPRPEARVVAFLRLQPIQSIHVSVVTLAETRFGIERIEDPSRRGAMNDWLDHQIRPMFVGRVLQVSEDVMLRWRILMAEGRHIRHTFSQPDLIIAATALHHGLTVVSRDVSGFDMTHVPVLNPWVGAV